MRMQVSSAEEALRAAHVATVGEKKDLAWYLGVVAHGKGFKLADNPFRVDCVNEYVHWRKGWSHAFENITR